MSLGPVAPVAAKTATSGIGIRLTEVAAADASNPRALLYVIDRIAPGATITRVVEVSNNTASTQQVACYDSAATIFRGAFVGADGSAGSELTGWMTMSQHSLTLKRGAKANIGVTFKVPSDASAGERYGAIWAEIRSKNAGSGIVSINRVGIRVYLSVGQGGAPPSSFEIKSVSVKRNTDGSPELDAIVANTGGRALDISGDLKLFNGPAGLTAGPFVTDLGTTLAIGESEVIRVRLPREVPTGPWEAELTLRSGLVSNSLSARVTFPPVGVARPIAIQSVNLFEILALTFAGAIALFALALIYRVTRRHLHTKRRGARRH